MWVGGLCARGLDDLVGAVEDVLGDGHRGVHRLGLLVKVLDGDEQGGKVGPDITGSNRADLDYLLHNILDPNAEIPNDYRTWNLDTKDDRSISGVMARQDATTVTIVTPSESLTIARSDIARLKQSELSMMPEGLLQALPEDEVRNLIAYLRGKEQVPLP